MLIEFKVGNFLSFKDVQTLRMAQVLDDGQRETSYGDPSERMFIYGANGSGKSNLIKAMAFAKDIILCGKSDISASTFENRSESEYSYFEYVVEIDGITYSYGFEINPKTLKPKSEWLYILQKGEDQCLFEEEISALVDGKGRLEYGSLSIENINEYRIYNFIYEKNLVFIPYLRLIDETDERYGHVKKIIEWFSRSVFIENSRVQNEIIPVSEHFYQYLGDGLKRFDTGIMGIIEEPFVNTDIPKNLIKHISSKDMLECDGHYLIIIIGGDSKRYWMIHAVNKGGIITYFEMKFVHEGGHKTTLENESLGTLRILQILALYSMMECNSSRDLDGVVVADELECSVHSLIMRKFIELFEEIGGKGQLIATIHRVDILGIPSVKDCEISFIDYDKTKGLGSHLYTLQSFDHKYDPDERRRAYLDGRMAGVPVLRRIIYWE